MTDDEYKAKIAAMSRRELLDEIMDNPNYLTDNYYRDFGRAMRQRAEELNAADDVREGA